MQMAIQKFETARDVENLKKQKIASVKEKPNHRK